MSRHTDPAARRRRLRREVREQFLLLAAAVAALRDDMREAARCGAFTPEHAERVAPALEEAAGLLLARTPSPRGPRRR